MNTVKNAKALEATWITLTARPGKEEELAKLLTGAAALVKAHEPATLSWYAIRLDAKRFAIFDTFPDEAGRGAHFAGQAAAALQQASADLVEGGWDHGVVANVRNARILSTVA
jgi:quinol monooxygenase YgiN